MVRFQMSFQSKREWLAQVAPRYQAAGHAQKSVILNEFIAATGYARKYAIRLLTQPVSLPAPIQRERERHYGKAVQEALTIAWRAANFICAKRLVPFLPELVPALEQHGHLDISPEVRTQLLTLSPATADRILKPLRQANPLRGLSTTKAGTLLKHQVPIRTFNDWNETQPGFFEIDLVAHCGNTVEGTFLCTCVLTDVVTGWTECQALLYRSQDMVIQAIDRARQLVPFPILGLDSDNGGEFLNAKLIAYCEQAQLTFTRGRAYKKNDQCFVEQKNGVIVRQFVGYDRFEGERAYRQLTELYRALRLYVNFFQPSMKLLTKRREGSKVYRTYDDAQTPLQRLFSAQLLKADARAHLDTIAHSLDPVRLLQQITALQDALWPFAIFPTPAARPHVPAEHSKVVFDVKACGLVSNTEPPQDQTTADDEHPRSTEPSATGSGMVALEPNPRRRYHRTATPRGPRTWRTRPDPFAAVWEEIRQALSAHPERTAKEVLLNLQQRYPEQFSAGQLRTLQRRVQNWRAKTMLAFEEHWVHEDLLANQPLPLPLQAIEETEFPPEMMASERTPIEATVVEQAMQ